MREFVFDLVYEEVTAPLERLCNDPTTVSSHGIGGCIDTDEFWRLERFSSRSGTLHTAITDAWTALLDVERLSPESCDGELHSEVLSQSESTCEVYYHLQDIRGCESVSTLAVEYLGQDVLFEVERSDNRETWTVMMESEDDIGLFYDAVQVTLRKGVRFEFGHIGEASDRRTAVFAPKNLPPEQREALVKAVEQGYYEKPRQVKLQELADQLGCPRSTLSYRLRTAESKLAKAFATNRHQAELESLPQTPDTVERA